MNRSCEVWTLFAGFMMLYSFVSKPESVEVQFRTSDVNSSNINLDTAENPSRGSGLTFVLICPTEALCLACRFSRQHIFV